MQNEAISAYNERQQAIERAICDQLAAYIDELLPEAESKIWHAHPVWFLDGNPVVGYSKQPNGIRLMFWSGAGFGAEKLKPGTGKFKDASVCYATPDEIVTEELKLWLKQAREIQWDYKNLVKRKGQLERLK